MIRMWAWLASSLLVIAFTDCQSDKIYFEDNPFLAQRISLKLTTPPPDDDTTEPVTFRLGLIGPAVGLPAVPGLPEHVSEEFVHTTEAPHKPPHPPPPPPPPPEPTFKPQSIYQSTYPPPTYPPKEDSNEECKCTSDCNPKNVDGTGLINIRIVVEHPPGVVCGHKEVYCCFESEPSTYKPFVKPSKDDGCGRYNLIPVGNVPVNYGQAQFGEFPWMAILLNQNSTYVGLGVLIDPLHVLTVAHKVASKLPTTVRLGDWKVADYVEPYQYVEVGIKWVRIHPEFNSGNLHNDVAIIRLEYPVELAQYPHINTACLPQHGVHLEDKRRCLVSGWGQDNFGPKGEYQQVLKRVDLPLVGGDECEQRLRRTRLGEYFKLDQFSFLCAGGEQGKDACTGDGGAPLVCMEKGRQTVMGLVAWGIGCADQGHPGVYLHVSNFIPWIQDQIHS